ncbi:hypothetical protein SDA89_14980, partial [Legionella pneumophila serogroup 1]
MHRFHNILFVSHGIKNETEALQLALKLASKNEAQLHILITCPPFPDTLSEYKTSYEASLIDKMNKAIQLAKSGLGVSKKKIPIDIEVDCGTTGLGSNGTANRLKDYIGLLISIIRYVSFYRIVNCEVVQVFS